MDRRRLRAGEWIFGVSGVLLAVSLLMPWWGLRGAWIELGPGGPVEGIDQGTGAVTTWSAWQVFSIADVLFLLLALLAIGVWALVAYAPAPGPGVAAEALLTPLAIAMAIVALVQVLGTPGTLDVPVSIPDPSIEYGAWLGLFSTCALLFGLLVAMRDERLSRPGELTDQTGLPVSARIAVEKLPAPPPA